jgi:putative DNA primase/helicase
MASPVVAPPAVERVLSRLREVTPVRGRDDRWRALCPAHPDNNPSLDITVGNDGRVLMICRSRGCAIAAIVAAIHLTTADLFADSSNGNHAVAVAPVVEKAKGVETRRRMVKSFDYHDANGTLVYQACRWEPGREGRAKDFTQRRPDGNGGWIESMEGVERVPYRLPELLDAIDADRRIFIVEGEKDVDTLAELGYPATTNVGGAGNWKDSYSAYLKNADVVILPDNDEPGKRHAEKVAASLLAAGVRVRVLELPNLAEKGDVTDWLNAGNTLEALEEMIERTPNRQTDAEKSRTRWKVSELWKRDDIMRPPPPVVPYLAWEGRSTLLAAREKSGKSTLTSYVATQVSRGGIFLGERCRKGPVLIFGLDEYIGDTAQRLQKFDCDGEAIEIVSALTADPETRLLEVKHHIEQQIEGMRPILVILDSLISYARGVVTDANDSVQNHSVVQGITNLAHELGVAIILIHHAKKEDGSYRDSSAIGGAVDIIAEVHTPKELKDTDPTRRRVRPIGRVPARPVDFRYDGDTYSLVDVGDTSKAPLDQRITSIVRDRPGISATDVCAEIGERRQQALAAITGMIASGRLVNAGDARRQRLHVPQFPPAGGFL